VHTIRSTLRLSAPVLTLNIRLGLNIVNSCCIQKHSSLLW